MPLPKSYGIAKGWALAPGQVGATEPPPAPALLPVATSAPVISGSPIADSTLTVSDAVWSNGPILSRVRQWYAADVPDAADEDWLAIEGASAAEYDAPTADIGSYLRVGEIASSAAGPGEESFSAAVGPVTEAGVWPATSSFRMGGNTRKGHWAYGNDLGYTGSGYLGIVSGDTSKFQIDAYNRLCPNGPGAYHTANAGLGTGPHVLTVAEYSDSGKTTPTGATQTVTVNIDVGDYDFGAHPLDTSTDSQLRTILILGAALVRPCNIWGHGYFNPTSAVWAIRPTATPWSGTGKVTVRSRVVDNSVDEHGHRRHRHGLQIGRFTAQMSQIGDVDLPLEFREVEGYVSNTAHDAGPGPFMTGGPAITAPEVNIFGYSVTNVGGGIELHDCGLRADAALITPMVAGAVLNLPAAVTGCVFDHINDGIKSTGPRNGGLISSGNVFRDLNGDEHSLGTSSGVLIENNFAYLPRYSGTLFHKDFVQWQMGAAGAPKFVTDVVIRWNIVAQAAMAEGTIGPWNAVVYIDDAVAGSTFDGLEIYGNIGLITNSYGVRLTCGTNPAIRDNTFICDIGNSQTSVTSVAIQMNPNGVSTGGDVLRNAVNGISPTAWPAITSTNNVEMPNNLGAVQTAWPNYSSAATRAVTNRAQAIAMMTPADLPGASGGLVNPDASVAGAVNLDGSLKTG